MIGNLLEAGYFKLVPILRVNNYTAWIKIFQDFFHSKIHVIWFLIYDWELGRDVVVEAIGGLDSLHFKLSLLLFFLVIRRFTLLFIERSSMWLLLFSFLVLVQDVFLLSQFEVLLSLILHHSPSVAEFELEFIFCWSSGKAGFGPDVGKDFGDGWPESRSVAK